MSCDICGRGSCAVSFHTLEEQERFEKAIEAFERARDLRRKIRQQMDEEEEQAMRESD